LYKEKKLPNMCLLLNDTDSTKGYGYGYGYGYGKYSGGDDDDVKAKTVIQKMIKKIRKV
jgi:hypothetical protein